MGKPGPNTDRSCSAALVRKIIRSVDMKAGLPPKQSSVVNTSVSTIIMFNKWRAATQSSCFVNQTTNPGHRNCVPEPKSTGHCGC